jgi:hypothetical protein
MDLKTIFPQTQPSFSFDKIKSEYLLGLDIGTEAVKSIIFQKEAVFQKRRKGQIYNLGQVSRIF